MKKKMQCCFYSPAKDCTNKGMNWENDSKMSSIFSANFVIFQTMSLFRMIAIFQDKIFCQPLEFISSFNLFATYFVLFSFVSFYLTCAASSAHWLSQGHVVTSVLNIKLPYIFFMINLVLRKKPLYPL